MFKVACALEWVFERKSNEVAMQAMKVCIRSRGKAVLIPDHVVSLQMLATGLLVHTR
jgi:hypothetical protein